jgi:hypothetical protein
MPKTSRGRERPDDDPTLTWGAPVRKATPS